MSLSIIAAFVNEANKDHEIQLFYCFTIAAASVHLHHHVPTSSVSQGGPGRTSQGRTCHTRPEALLLCGKTAINALSSHPIRIRVQAKLLYVHSQLS